MDFEFKQFSQESFKLTKDDWIISAESLGYSSFEFEKSLEYASSRITYEENAESYSYGIFRTGSNSAVALVDVSHTTRVKDVGWLKMLNVDFSPAFSMINTDIFDTKKFSEKLEIYVASISGTINLTNHHKAKVVKLYGRNEHLLMLLNALNYHLTKNPDSEFGSRIEGRWLVVSTH